MTPKKLAIPDFHQHLLYSKWASLQSPGTLIWTRWKQNHVLLVYGEYDATAPKNRGRVVWVADTHLEYHRLSALLLKLHFKGGLRGLAVDVCGKVSKQDPDSPLDKRLSWMCPTRVSHICGSWYYLQGERRHVLLQNLTTEELESR